MTLAMNVQPLVGADRDQIARFVRALFKYADEGTFVSLRAFYDHREGVAEPARAVKINGAGLSPLIDDAERMAARCSAANEPVVFCPPVATFQTATTAKETDLANGLALSVELDTFPDTARQLLESLLGAATLVVASGGEWMDDQTGEIQPKLHLHWRLTEPTTTSADHALLKEARRLATALAGGDATNIPACHPIRWPGSWHRKRAPRLAQIVAENENEIELTDAIEVLRESAGAMSIEIAKKIRATGAATSETLRAGDPAVIPGAAKRIRNDDLDWSEWNRLGMAFFAASGGSEEGFAAFDEWSQKSSKYDALATLARWEHYRRSPPTRIGAGTLVHAAREVDPEFLPPPTTDWAMFRAAERAAMGKQEQPGGNIDLFLSSRQFVEKFVPKSFLLKGIIEEGRLYTMTGPTGTGKTAVALLIGMCVARGLPVGNLKTKKAPVLFLAGENPDDVRTRYIAMLEQAGVSPDDVDMHFREGFFSIEQQKAIVLEFIAQHQTGLVIVDTLQAFFDGDDSNSNEQMKAMAQAFRSITMHGPAVVIPAHPKKSPTRDTNEPYGGGALINEIDGNLALWGDMDSVELYWCKKFRGAFDPVNFALTVGPLRDHKDADGDPIITVTAKAISDSDAAKIMQGHEADENVLLYAMNRRAGGSLSQWAQDCFEASGDISWSKRKVQTVMKRLAADKFVRLYRRKYVITESGKEALNGGSA